MAQATTEQECIARIAAEIQFLTERRLGRTDDEITAFIKLTEMDIMINDILKSKAADRAAAIENARRIETELTQLAMHNEELRGQIQARQEFLDKITILARQSNVRLSDLAAAVEFIEKRRVDNQWDENQEEFSRIASQSDELVGEMKALVNAYYTNSKAAATKASQLIQNNGFPTLCYIMTFLCVLPLECRNAVVAYLQGTPLGNLASMSLSEQACLYWKAKTATYMYNNVANLSIDQIERATNMLYGVGINCKDMCYALLLNFNTLVSRAAVVGENFLLNIASSFSDKVGLVPVGLINDALADRVSESSISSGSSRWSVATAETGPPSLIVQVLAAGPARASHLALDHFNSDNNAQVESYMMRYIDSMQGRAARQRGAPSAAGLTIQRPDTLVAAAGLMGVGSPPPDTPVDSRGRRIADQFIGSQSDTPTAANAFGASLVFPALTAEALEGRQGRNAYAFPAAPAASDASAAAAYFNSALQDNQYRGILENEDQERRKRTADDAADNAATKKQGIEGGRRRKRKSMRHRKRRSTLKRRKLKRRNTRKGKKKRYTKKRR
jgi:hypothetical protein